MVYNLITQDAGGSLLVRSEVSSTRGHDLKLYKSSAKSKMRKFAFSQRVVALWNNLDFNTVHAPTINSFKKLLDINLNHLYFRNGLE